MNILKIVPSLALSCLFAGAPIAQAADPVADKIVQLRSQREKAIAAAIEKANAEYANGLDRLKSLYGSKPAAGTMIAREKEELGKVSLVTLPPIVRITTEIAAATVEGPREKLSIKKPDDLTRYLIGTSWRYYSNGKFLGDPKTLEFTGHSVLMIDGKEFEWKALDKARFWMTGDREFTFSKQFDEFTGGWAPNPKDQNSGRIIK